MSPGEAALLPIRPEDPVERLRGATGRALEALRRLGIERARDLLYHLPRRHEDRRDPTPLSVLEPGRPATCRARVEAARARRIRGGRTLVEVDACDGTGRLRATFWNQPWVARALRPGMEVFLTGTPVRRGRLSMPSPEFERIEDEGAAGPSLHAGRVVPIYPLAVGIGQKAMRRLAAQALAACAAIEDPVPPPIRERRGLPSLAEALSLAHFPRDVPDADRARRRLAYDELLALSLAVAARRERERREGGAPAIAVGDALDLRIRALFPFAPTGAQERAFRAVRADLGAVAPMNRLLQGDVGSGKTAVAAYALLAAVGAGFQAALLAPTEVLAAQHLRALERLLALGRVRTVLLAGSLSSAERRKALSAIAEGEADIAVGTHALFEEEVRFARLGVCVVDEQHKFGVLQRARLQAKGRRPHTLVMTATPIPRSLALALYADLDISVLDEQPPGRALTRTYLVPPAREEAAIQFVRRELSAGRRAYVVFPAIEGSERRQVRGAESALPYLLDRFRGFAVALLTGALPAVEKDRAMEAFRDGRVQVLAATSVVEVGLDVAEASVMLVVDAERFGLAQLHQLRGRVGRGGQKGYCLLFGEAKTAEAEARLRCLCETGDGFRIAEEDLRLRGPGELFGARQAGLPPLRVADLSRDQDLLGAAREDARDLLARGAEGPLVAAAAARYGTSLDLVRVG